MSCLWLYSNPVAIHSSKQKSPIVHQEPLNVSNPFFALGDSLKHQLWSLVAPRKKISASKRVVKCIPGGGNIDSNLTLLAKSKHRHNKIILGVNFKILVFRVNV